MARAIDADELIKFPHSESAGTDEQIENWIEECGLSDEGVIDRAKKLCWAVIDGFINVVKTAPTLTPPNEWVSVDERLPETDGQNTHDYDVLVYIPKRDGCHQHGIYIGKLKKVPADDGSWNFWGIKTESSEWTVWGWGYLENPVVTHWMPLPAPPDCRPPEGEEDT